MVLVTFVWDAYSKRQKALAFQDSACLSKTHEMALKDPFQRRLIDFKKLHISPSTSIEPATFGSRTLAAPLHLRPSGRTQFDSRKS